MAHYINLKTKINRIVIVTNVDYVDFNVLLAFNSWVNLVIGTLFFDCTENWLIKF